MRNNEALLIFPKRSTYEMKPPEERAYVRDVVEKWLVFTEKYRMPLCCFAVDDLAYTFLGGRKVRWLDVLGSADSRLLAKNPGLGFQMYGQVDREAVEEAIIEKARKQFKAVRVREFTSTEELQEECFKVACKRIRYACSLYMEKCKATILYFNAGAGFCSVPECVFGDEKKVIKVDVATGVASCSYSGLPVSISIMEQVLESGVVK